MRVSGCDNHRVVIECETFLVESAINPEERQEPRTISAALGDKMCSASTIHGKDHCSVGGGGVAARRGDCHLPSL